MSSKKTFIFITISVCIHAATALFFYLESRVPEEKTFSLNIIETAGTAAKPKVTRNEKPRVPSIPITALKGEQASFESENLNQNAEGDSAAGTVLKSNKGIQNLDLQISYPRMSKHSREEGRAEYSLDFNREFKLVGFKRLKSSGFDRLDQAVESALNLKLKPADEAAALREILIIDFRLKGSSSQVVFL